jgi:ubiquinone/menaquinone biosynthesis C-methylase UbiE
MIIILESYSPLKDKAIMELDKKLLKEVQYSNPQGYRNRLALLEFATEKFDLWQWTASHYNFSSVKDILEVGCGTGDFWRYVNTENPFENIQLTDFAPGMLKTAQETLSNSPLFPKMHFNIADAENLHYANKTFDAVLAHLMLYHTQSKKQALNEIIRVLKPQGWVGITTFNIKIQNKIFSLAHSIDSRFPPYAVTIESFDEAIADELLPKFFSNIEKNSKIVSVKVPDASFIDNLIRSHPVSQKLGLTDEFFIPFEEKVKEIIKNNGTFDDKFFPVSYICKNPIAS